MQRFSGPRKTANLSESVHQQLSMYALAASAAGVGMLVLVQPAEARIVYTRIHRIIRPIDGYYALDLNHDGKVDFVLGRSRVSDGSYVRSTLAIDPYIANSANGVIATAVGTDTPAIALRAGPRIGPKELFNLGRITVIAGHGTVSRTRHSSYWVGQWDKGGKGLRNRYLGLRFSFQGKVHFGWARVTVTTSGKDFTAILTGYAYETKPDKSIKAGQIKEAAGDTTNEESGPGASLTNPIPDTPQPASLGMLALGAQGVPWRRKESIGAAQ
jgi:hypothetical protein